MAINWGETYGTIIDSAKWEESIEGYKITNVFGLAWNYYVIYTKFITGMDITLDMGLKPSVPMIGETPAFPLLE